MSSVRKALSHSYSPLQDRIEQFKEQAQPSRSLSESAEGAKLSTKGSSRNILKSKNYKAVEQSFSPFSLSPEKRHQYRQKGEGIYGSPPRLIPVEESEPSDSSDSNEFLSGVPYRQRQRSRTFAHSRGHHHRVGSYTGVPKREVPKTTIKSNENRRRTTAITPSDLESMKAEKIPLKNNFLSRSTKSPRKRAASAGTKLKGIFKKGKKTRNLHFGRPLKESLQISIELGVPHITTQCIAYLNQTEILKTEGLFRVPGSAKKVNELKEKFDSSKKRVQLPPGVFPSTVSSVLKYYFSELPDSLIPMSFHSKFVSACDSGDKKQIISNLTNIIRSLPHENKAVLKNLIELLNKVAQNSQVNKMDINNLSIVFGNNLSRSNESGGDFHQQLNTSKGAIESLRYLIENYKCIFVG